MCCFGKVGVEGKPPFLLSALGAAARSGAMTCQRGRAGAVEMEPQSSHGAALPLCFFLGEEEPVFHPRCCPLFRAKSAHTAARAEPLPSPGICVPTGATLHSQIPASYFPSQVQARSRPPAAVALPGGAA